MARLQNGGDTTPRISEKPPWDSIVISDATKSCAWRGVMEAMREDEAVPAYAKAMFELLVEDRRELLETQKSMVIILRDIQEQLSELRTHAKNLEKKGDARRSDVRAQSVGHVDLMESATMNGLLEKNALLLLQQSVNGTSDGRVSSRSTTPPQMANTDHTDTSSIARSVSPPNAPELSQLVAQFPFLEQHLDLSGGAGGDDDSGIDVKPIDVLLSMDTSMTPTHTNSRKRKRPEKITEVNGNTSKDPSSFPCRAIDCTEVFDSPEELVLHVAKHGQGNKPYQCPVCGLGMMSETRLRDHVHQHTGERPYSCQFCGRGFSRKDGRLVHMRKCAERHGVAQLNTEATFA